MTSAEPKPERMTREQRKKAHERIYVETAARLLGETWKIEDGEGPDFHILADQLRFGLEVTQVHIDEDLETSGSQVRAAEARNRNWLREIVRSVETSTGAILDVKFLGVRSDSAADFMRTSLATAKFENMSIGERREWTSEEGHLWATKAFRSQVCFIRDNVGWVSGDSAAYAMAIARKASKLEGYRNKTGNVRLLVVADRTANSGKIIFDVNDLPPSHGFDVIYLLSYPTEIVCF